MTKRCGEKSTSQPSTLLGHKDLAACAATNLAWQRIQRRRRRATTRRGNRGPVRLRNTHRGVVARFLIAVGLHWKRKDYIRKPTFLEYYMYVTTSKARCLVFVVVHNLIKALQDKANTVNMVELMHVSVFPYVECLEISFATLNPWLFQPLMLLMRKQSTHHIHILLETLSSTTHRSCAIPKFYTHMKDSLRPIRLSEIFVVHFVPHAYESYKSVANLCILALMRTCAHLKSLNVRSKRALHLSHSKM